MIVIIQVLDLEYLLDCFPEDNFTKKYRALNEALTGLITDYRLVINLAFHILYKVNFVHNITVIKVFSF